MTFSQQATDILRPRLTVKYVLSAVACSYVLYCIIVGSPLLSSRIPQYTGPHAVGTVDIEAPVKQRLITPARLKETGEPAFELKTVLFSLFYPADVNLHSSTIKHYWFSKPLSAHAEGYARFAHFNNWFSRPIFTFALWALAGRTTIPANVDVPLHISRAGGAEMLRVQGRDEDKYPVIVFSHGQASTRTSYTQYCGELASRGYVVAAIEHRDGSAPGTVIKKEDGTEEVLYTINFGDIVADYEIDYDKYKQETLAVRQAEVEETIEVLRRLNKGHGAEVLENNTRFEGQDLPRWKGKLDTENLIMAGHSFGATLAMQALKGAPSGAIPAKGGIILDPGKSSGRLNEDINVPIMVIHSNSWSKAKSVFYGRPHFGVVKDIVQNVKDRVGASWFLTSIGTSHPSVTDAPLIEPLLLSWTTGATIDVHEGVREYVGASMDFLKFVRTGQRQGLLKYPVSHPEYDEKSEDKDAELPKEVAKYWQIHVA